MQIGDTLYHFDINRREYTRPERKDGHVWGDLIYAGHFHPLKIVGETRTSWLLEFRYKVKKTAIGEYDFFTWDQMQDQIWKHEHRHKIRDLLDRATPVQLRSVAAVLGYEPPR